MASYTLSPIGGAGAQFFDNNGTPLSGGKIYTYAAGTTTLQTTWVDPAGITPNANPIVLDSAGRPPQEIWLSAAYSYKFVIETSNGILIRTYDNIPGLPQPGLVNDASSISYEQGNTVTAGAFVVGNTYMIASVGSTNFVAIGAAANSTGVIFTATGAGSGTGTAYNVQTVAAKLQQTVSVKDFGAVGDGVADDTAAFNAALASTAKCIYVPGGSYRLTSLVDMNGVGRSIEGDGYNATIIYVDHANGGFRSLSSYQSIKGMKIACARAAGSAFGISSNAAYFTAKDVFTDWNGVGKFVNGVIIPAGAAEPYVRYFENCVFSTTSSDAFFVEEFSFNHAVFVDCTFRSAGASGFYLYGGSSHGISFHGCRAENNTLHGFNIAGRRGNHASWHGVYVENNGGAGIYLGTAAPAWNTDADYMESCSISGLTAWQQGLAAVVAEKCIGVTISGASAGSNDPGKFTLGAFRGGWSGYPLKGPQMKLNNVNRRGTQTDYDLVYPGSSVMVESGEGRAATYDQGWSPSSNITRINVSGGRYGFGPTGAYASDTITLGKRASLTSPGVSAFATTNSVMGPSANGAVISSDNIDLDAVPENSQLNAIIASDYSTWETASDKYRQVILASSRVKSVNNATVTGGVAVAGSALSANRKWEIDSVTGNITVAGTVTTGAIFSDFAEMFPNATGAEIPLGVIVTQENGAVRPANDGDDIIGVVSATAAITAGDTPFAWQGRYLMDEWGRVITDQATDPNWNQEGPAPLINIPRENPAWNPDLPQIPRSARPSDWTRVGMIGQVFVRVAANVSPNDSLSAINGIGVKSANKTGLRCLKITVPYSSEKGYAVARCLINAVI